MKHILLFVFKLHSMISKTYLPFWIFILKLFYLPQQPPNDTMGKSVQVYGKKEKYVLGKNKSRIIHNLN